jgi:histidine triad (HIT) family protein
MENCIFCKIAKGEANSYKVYEDENTFAFLDINPAAEFHTLVIPKAHYVNVLDIPQEIFSQVMETVKKVVDIYKNKLGLENLQLIHSAGREGQQDVFHLHVHIVPRSFGDGQNVKWKTRTELREKFDSMLERIKL